MGKIFTGFSEGVTSLLSSLKDRVSGWSLNNFNKRLSDWITFRKECWIAVLSFPVLATALYVGTVKQIEAGGTPIVFDLNGNGKIDITGHNSARDKLYTVFTVGNYVEFDIFNSGTLTKIDWIEGNTDAFLVDLRKGIPKAANGSHLFGAGEGQDGKFHDSGFDKLATLDANSNGAIEGKELEGLALWQDDGDAILQASEIRQLAEFEVTSIPTKYQKQKGSYGLEQLVTTVETNKGEMYVEDIWFMTSDQPTPLDRFLGAVFHPFSNNG